MRHVYLVILALWLCDGLAVAQNRVGIGRGLVLLDTAPPIGSAHAFNFVESVAADTSRHTFGTESARTILAYGVPGFNFVGDGIDERPEAGLMADNGYVTTFSDSLWFQPLGTTPHHETTALRWIGREGEWLNVVVNESSGETLWLRLGPHLAVLSWEDLFTGSDCAERLLDPESRGDAYNQPVRTRPSDDAPGIGSDLGLSCFEVTEINGEWLGVKDGRDQREGSWWIRWRDGDQLLAFPGSLSKFIGRSD